MKAEEKCSPSERSLSNMNLDRSNSESAAEKSDGRTGVGLPSDLNANTASALGAEW